jgi:hypothetical protein
MPQVGFEPTIPMFERTKTFHALDRAGHHARQETCNRRIKFLMIRSNHAESRWKYNWPANLIAWTWASASILQYPWHYKTLVRCYVRVTYWSLELASSMSAWLFAVALRNKTPDNSLKKELQIRTELTDAIRSTALAPYIGWQLRRVDDLCDLGFECHRRCEEFYFWWEFYMHCHKWAMELCTVFVTRWRMPVL